MALGLDGLDARRFTGRYYMIHRQPANFIQGISLKSLVTASVMLAVVDPELQQAFAQLEARLTARIDAVEARLEERIESTETKLLTAFHNWAQTYEASWYLNGVSSRNP